jgi:hypothetical protein
MVGSAIDDLIFEMAGTQIPEEPLCLIMDQFKTHIAPEIEEEAELLGIKIIWMRKAGTG